MSSVNDAYMRKINKILRQNRRILADLTPDEKNYVSRIRLEDRGFNFSYFTHTRPARQEGFYTFCYEYGYIEIKQDLFLVFEREDKRKRETSRPAEQA